MIPVGIFLLNPQFSFQFLALEGSGMRQPMLKQAVLIAVTLMASQAFAQGGSAVGSREVHKDPDGKLWVEY